MRDARDAKAGRGGQGSIAQLGEHLPYKQGVTGSSPVLSTIYLARWCSRLARQPVTLEVEGSSPFRVAMYAWVAQLVEQQTENLRVGGSTPPLGTICGSSSVVECHLAKVDVASPNLVYRSTVRV